MKQMKGITPVIAVVLLLLVTIGAVGVVYTQFQDIAGGVNTNPDYLDTIDAKIGIITSEENDSEGNGIANNKTMQVSFENTGGSAYNLSSVARLEYRVDGEQPIEPGSLEDNEVHGFDYNSSIEDCLEAASPLGVDTTTSCNTGVQFPEVSDEITVLLVRKGAEGSGVVDEKTCNPQSINASTC
jgi:flagellin-like protein